MAISAPAQPVRTLRSPSTCATHPPQHKEASLASVEADGVKAAIEAAIEAAIKAGDHKVLEILRCDKVLSLGEKTGALVKLCHAKSWQKHTCTPRPAGPAVGLRHAALRRRRDGRRRRLRQVRLHVPRTRGAGARPRGGATRAGAGGQAADEGKAGAPGTVMRGGARPSSAASRRGFQGGARVTGTWAPTTTLTTRCATTTSTSCRWPGAPLPSWPPAKRPMERSLGCHGQAHTCSDRIATKDIPHGDGRGGDHGDCAPVRASLSSASGRSRVHGVVLSVVLSLFPTPTSTLLRCQHKPSQRIASANAPTDCQSPRRRLQWRLRSLPFGV